MLRLLRRGERIGLLSWWPCRPCYPSDVQYPGLGGLEPIYPPSAAEQTTPEQAAAMEQEYLAMEQEIADIRIVLNHIQAGTLEQSDRMNSNEAARRWHAASD